MGDQEVKLIGAWASPFSKRVEIALKMKGISYEFVAQDLSNKSPELLQSNPVHKKVPVLLHKGKPICESLIILEYIDETWKSGPSILPKDPYARSTARFWAKFIDDKCHPVTWKITRSQGEEKEKAIAVTWKITRSQGEEKEKAIEEATEHLTTLENELKGKRFFGGDEIGLIDIAGNFVALWLGVLLEVVGIKLLSKEKYPKLCEWVDDYLNCSIFKETLPPREELLAFFRSWFQQSN